MRKKLDIDLALKTAPPRDKTTVAELAKHIASHAIRHTERALVAYRWIAENIVPDVEKFYAGKCAEGNPAEALQSGKGTSKQFATLYVELLQAMEIEAIVITGWGKGPGFDPEKPDRAPTHHWSAARLDGVWELIDVMWGAGWISGRDFVAGYDRFYFCPDPWLFLKTHFPNEEKYQFLESPLPRAQFDTQLRIKSLFFNQGFTSIRPEAALLDCTTGQISIKLTYDSSLPDAPIVLPILSRIDGTSSVEQPLTTFAQRTRECYEVVVNLAQEGIYNLTLFTPKVRAETKLVEMATYRLKVTGPNNTLPPLPELYLNFQTLKGRLLQPLQGSLALGTTVPFQVYVEGPQDLAVRVGENWTVLELQKASGIYAADVDIDSPSIILFAKKPGTDSYDALLKFKGEDTGVQPRETKGKGKAKDTEQKEETKSVGKKQSEETKAKIVPLKRDMETIKACGLANYPKEGLLHAKANYLEIQLDSAPECVLMTELTNEKQEEILNAVFLQSITNHHHIHVAFPDNGQYKLAVFAKPHGKDGTVPFAFEYSINVQESERKKVSFPKQFAAFLKAEAFLYEPLSGILKVGSDVQFRIKVIKAVSVEILAGDLKIVLKKTDDNVYYTDKPVRIPDTKSLSLFSVSPAENSIIALKTLLSFDVEP